MLSEDSDWKKRVDAREIILKMLDGLIKEVTSFPDDFQFTTGETDYFCEVGSKGWKLHVAVQKLFRKVS